MLVLTDCGAGYEGGGDMMSLDEEISHLQKENSQVDSQLHRMKSDVGGMETEAASDDKVELIELTVKTKIKHFLCFRKPRRLKDVTPSYQTTMKTSEPTYFLSLVSSLLISMILMLNVIIRSEARDEGARHGQPGEVRQLPDQAPEHLH